MSDDPRSNRAPETPVEPNQEKSPKPWFLATRFVVIVASVLVLAIVGTVVGVSAHNASVTASLAAQQAAAKRADAAKKKLSLDCPEYASLSEAKRAAEADKLTPPTVTFNSIGTTTPSSVDFYDSVCKSASPGTSLEMLSKEVAQQYPSCRDFLKLPVAVQNSWSAATWQLWGTTQFTLEGTQQTPALIMGCQAPDAVPNATLQDSARALVLFMATHSDSGALASYLAGQADTTPSATPTPTAPPASHQIIWTEATEGYEASLGYTETSTVTWGTVQRGTATTTYPGDPSFVLGSACGYDPTKDVYITGLWTITNSTPSFSEDLKASLEVGYDPYGPVEIEYLSECGLGTGDPIQASVQSISAVAPGQSITTRFFVIIKNYYSPATPNGDVAALTAVVHNGGALVYGGPGTQAPLG
jgi:hypothetical protein